MNERPRLFPLLLDLFCGAGGSAMGFWRAGFEIVGVDVRPQPHYPFEFVQDDALTYVDRVLFHTGCPSFDAIHASPPCQAYTLAQRIRSRDHEDLIGPTRELLEQTGLPWIIENVPGAPLRDPVWIEGQRFPELRTIRTRLFEANWPLDVFELVPPRPRQAMMGRHAQDGEWPQIVGHFTDVKGARAAMGIDWMTRDELSEAVPPAYTELIGRQLLLYLHTAAAA